jgi:probable DNA metabolism protein
MEQKELFEDPREKAFPEIPSLEEVEKASYFRGDTEEGDRAYRIWRETDRLRGLLRFRKDDRGRYIARCAPDYFVLPLLGDHFLQRFGDLSWAIIDEKRNLVLFRERGKMPVLAEAEIISAGESSREGWEELWKNYHRSVNNENRANPELQRQFMPRRYWKYLPEMN